MLSCFCMQAQQRHLPVHDSLYNKTFKYLAERIDQEDSAGAWPYIRTYLHKAKLEHNWREISSAYKYYLHQSAKQQRLFYADSMVTAAKKTKDNEAIGAAYLTKGITFYGEKRQMEAFDNYILANDYIMRTDNSYLKHKVRYNIAHIKYYLGQYDEATALFLDCIAYFKNEDDRPYLNALHSLALCYNRMGNYKLCSQTDSLGLAEGRRLHITEMEPYFRHSEGVNQYFLKHYSVAIEMLKGSLKPITQKGDFSNVAIGCFYIGKSHWSLQQPEKAIQWFQKVDSIFNAKAYMRPDLRENYEILINYYKAKDQPKIQLHYIDQLLKSDSIMTLNYKYLSGKIYKEYDAKKLLHDKKQIESSLKKRDMIDLGFVILIIILFFTVLFLVYRHLRNQQLFRQKFEELMSRNESLSAPLNENIKSKGNTAIDINPDVITQVLKHLDKFEKNNKFLDKDMTLVKLAAITETNTKYASKIIMHYKNKKYIDYINDLRINYIIKLLKSNSRYRNYTYKALAQESGFSTAQHFAKAFNSNTGLTPSYFIEELGKSEPSQ